MDMYVVLIQIAFLLKVDIFKDGRMPEAVTFISFFFPVKYIKYNPTCFRLYIIKMFMGA